MRKTIRLALIAALVILAGGCDVLYGWGAAVPRTTTSSAPVDIGEGRPWVSLGAGSLGWCGVTGANRLFCSQFAGLQEVVPPAAATPDWLQVAVGGDHTCATTRAGALFCWGANGVGQLGTGGTGDSAQPVRVGSASDWRSVAAGETGTCGIRGAGDLYCWGGGQLVGNLIGDGGTDGRALPTPVGAGATWKSVDLGSGHACALRTSGELYCWGGDGFVGDGTTSTRLIPTKVGTATDWSAVSVGPYHSCGLRAGGELYCWGPNRDGEIGDGSPGQARRSPVRVGTQSDWTVVSAGGIDRSGGSGGDEYLAAHTCAIRAGGELWCWGANWRNELGDGTTVSRSAPVRVGTASNWTVVAAGGGFTRALRSPS